MTLFVQRAAPPRQLRWAPDLADPLNPETKRPVGVFVRRSWPSIPRIVASRVRRSRISVARRKRSSDSKRVQLRVATPRLSDHLKRARYASRSDPTGEHRPSIDTPKSERCRHFAALPWRAGYPARALRSRRRQFSSRRRNGFRYRPRGAYSSLDPGKAILTMGRPTLVVPDGVNSLHAEHVVIGWKDTREARRAVQDALPVLHEATRVTIVEICGPGEEKTALGHIDDVARYLTRHRVNGGPRVMLQKEGSGAAQLIRLARDEGADLLVAGAYGHSRLGEWIFGGMTRDLLATSPICCLMSH